MKGLWLAFLILSAIILTATGNEALHAHGNVTEARRELQTVSEQAAELMRLRTVNPEELLPPKPATGLASQVSGAFAKCGIPGSTLQSLSPEAETPCGTACIRQRATLNLAGITLPQLGSFLSVWRDGNYTVSSIDLTPNRGNASPGADLPLHAVLTLEGLFRAAPDTAPTPAKSGARP